MVQPPGTGGADIHARAFAHRLQTLKNLDLFGAVGRLNLRGINCFGHAVVSAEEALL